jgi:hypothetical protein
LGEIQDSGTLLMNFEALYTLLLLQQQQQQQNGLQVFFLTINFWFVSSKVFFLTYQILFVASKSFSSQSICACLSSKPCHTACHACQTVYCPYTNKQLWTGTLCTNKKTAKSFLQNPSSIFKPGTITKTSKKPSF